MKIAIFYHVRISGGAHGPSPAFAGNSAIEPLWAASIVQEQISALYAVGLMDVADEMFIGLNGGADDYRILKGMAPNANVIIHGEHAASELPTLAFLESWVKDKSGWYVLYMHAKGVCWPPSKEGWELRQAWRRCMMHHVITNWTRCAHDLQAGYDMVGAHWLTSDKYNNAPAEALKKGIWGGNFWFSTSEYLKQLPKLQKNHGWSERYQAEMWPTSGRVPRVKDYSPHWPSLVDCGRA